MYIGLDIGGTHTDGALLDEFFIVKYTIKTPTIQNNIAESLSHNLKNLLTGQDSSLIMRLVVSSTLGLNALLTGRAEPVGVLVTGGPGLPPEPGAAGPLFRKLSGSLDHRGEIVVRQSPVEAGKAAADLAAAGARAWAVVSKFGPKNSIFEEMMADAALSAGPDFPITRGSRLAGRLNFPRRINTAVFNSGLMNLFRNFIKDIESTVSGLGLRCPVSFLSADGGSLSAEEAAEKPVLAAPAGPAAGLLGLWSLAGLTGDALLLDIGGTSTDIAVMADGQPLMTAEGLIMAGRPTLVRAFLTSSIALGGDSRLWLDRGEIRLGPEREGPALSLCPEDLGHRAPTLTDALNVLGLARLGDTEISRQALAALADDSPDFAGSPEKMAASALDMAGQAILTATEELMFRVNNRPVYTVGEMRLMRQVAPERAALLGGPAEALAGLVGRALNLPTAVSPLHTVANAVGAARSIPCPAAELYADTARGVMTIPALDVSRQVGRGYNLPEAERDILESLGQVLSDRPESGPARVVEAESFNQVAGYGRADRIIRVRAQAEPGYLGG